MQTPAPLPLDIPLLFLILLVELLFGIGFNKLVEWAHQHNLWHVSVSVVFGVAGTLVIPSVAFLSVSVPFWQVSLIFGACFVASGIPMIAGGTQRTVKESHHRRPLPNYAMRIRDDVVMEISKMLDEMVNEGVTLALVVHRWHKIIGRLKSM